MPNHLLQVLSLFQNSISLTPETRVFFENYFLKTYMIFLAISNQFDDFIARKYIIMNRIYEKVLCIVFFKIAKVTRFWRILILR